MLITAKKGRDGAVTITAAEDPLGGTNYQPMQVDRAVIVAGSAVLDSDVDTDDVDIIGNKITFKKGAFDLAQGEYCVDVIVYNTTYPNGKTIVGSGLENTLEMDFRIQPV
ncbi:hypothetical protein [Neptunicella sp.]|uniref:hypothetical protein n=1 Tax=Neptunicella sp. TaxID=2125986 RepID=UPI003F691BEE